LARTLFYDFPVTPLNEMLIGTERAASMEAAILFLMASHWPPENLPVREVELGLATPSLGCSIFSSRGTY
jgi:hypothetical protein